ncbi:MAG: aminotransferase class IV [Verrucomicrobia bacterium]|nr:aminotransferase class IV [Verrucomicrobiota bacterium]
MSKPIKFWLNGGLHAAGETKIPVNDRGFLLGDALFETLQVRENLALNWRAHWERLHHGLELCALSLPYSEAAMLRGIGDVMRANEAKVGVIRWTVSRGEGSRGYFPVDCHAPNVLIQFRALPQTGDGAISAATSPWTIYSKDPLQSIKSTSRLNYVIMAIHAQKSGVDECLVLNENQEIVEWLSGNFLILTESKLIGPPKCVGRLDGVTVPVIVQAAGEMGIPYSAVPLRLSELDSTSTLLLTNSTRIVQPVHTLDSKPYPTRPDLVNHLFRNALDILLKSHKSMRVDGT